MRMMMRVTMPVEAGNKALRDDVIPKLIQQTTDLIKPEAAYFAPDHGQRTAYFFFDMKDSSQLVSVGEPWFMGVNARVEFLPVMNGEDLKSGLSKIQK